MPFADTESPSYMRGALRFQSVPQALMPIACQGINCAHLITHNILLRKTLTFHDTMIFWCECGRTLVYSDIYFRVPPPKYAKEALDTCYLARANGGKENINGYLPKKNMFTEI